MAFFNLKFLSGSDEAVWGGMFPMANRLVIVGIIVRIIKLKSAFLELSPPPQTNMTGKAPNIGLLQIA